MTPAARLKKSTSCDHNKRRPVRVCVLPLDSAAKSMRAIVRVQARPLCKILCKRPKEGWTTQSIMTGAVASSLPHLPHELLSFNILRTASTDNNARLGQLLQYGRLPIDTPHYFAISSRGTVPHMTPDMMRDETSIRGMYAGLEDCMHSSFSCCLTSFGINTHADIQLARARKI